MIKLIPQTNSTELTKKIFDYDFENNSDIVDISFQEFANGEITVVINESLRNDTIIIVSQPKTYRDSFELIFTIDAAKRASAKEIVAVIPYLPHSRQERRNGLRTTISAKVYADMLQSAGVDRIITFDLHTTAIEGFYNIPVDNLTTLPLLFDDALRTKGKFYGEKCADILVSPDFGALKRLEQYADDYYIDLAILSKNRHKPNEVSRIKIVSGEENVLDRRCIIVDDMIDTGGTIKAATELLLKKGAAYVDIYCTHGIFSNNALDKIFENVSYNENVFLTTTNTYTSDKYGDIGQIDVAPLIVERIYQLFPKYDKYQID